ncbi:hydrogenase expression/formation protein HypE [Ectothiorhodospiraceae bacterium BW-2]|nr:hydrogenase expression/formation protein HypE [Ectothiorhodospiraceae bacterium BW-2]
MDSPRITLAHGNGGRLMRQLIEALLLPSLSLSAAQCELDSAPLPTMSGESLITTDGFTVKPLIFPGGSIGSLAIHGTVNDLAVAGAIAHSLTLNLFIEEGLEIALLRQIIDDMATAAREANITIVAGDTKVVPRGEGSGLYLATTGVGQRSRPLPGPAAITPGDRLVINGSIGDHGSAVMLAREAFGLSGPLASDSANITPLCQQALEFESLRFLRDPTRGGVATLCHDLCRLTGLGVRLFERQLPINGSVTTLCDMLGYDPLYLANEGKVVAVIAAAQAEALCQRWRSHRLGAQSAIIGEVVATPAHLTLQTELGGERLLHELEDDPLPRIC